MRVHDTSNVALRLLSDYDAKNPGTIFGEGLRLSIEEAFEVQRAVAELRKIRGEEVVGYKIGCVAPENQIALGVKHPVFGRLWSSEQFSGPCLLKKSDYVELGVEAEFGVTLRKDLHSGHTSLESILHSIANIFVVIELHNMRLLGPEPRASEVISNNAIHSGFVAGPKVELPKKPTATDLSLVMDGVVVNSWPEIIWPDDVLRAVPWLIQKLADCGEELRAGDVVLTAAFGPPVPVNQQIKIEVKSSLCSGITASFQ